MRPKHLILAAALAGATVSVPLFASPADAATPGAACTIDANASLLLSSLHGSFDGTVTADGQSCVPVPEEISNPLFQGRFDELLVAGAPCNQTAEIGFFIEATTDCPN